MGMSFDGNRYEENYSSRRERRRMMRELEKRRLRENIIYDMETGGLANWNDNSYTGIKPKEPKVEILQPEDIEIDTTYFKLGGEDGEGEGEGSGNESDSGQNEGESTALADAEDFINEVLDSYIDDKQHGRSTDAQESILTKLLDLDSMRINLKKKFRF